MIQLPAWQEEAGEAQGKIDPGKEVAVGDTAVTLWF